MEPKDQNMVNEAKSKEDTKSKKVALVLRKDSQKSIKSENDEALKSRHSISSAKENKDTEKENKDVLGPITASPKVPRKFINNWKQACDRTKDKTKELLKKWRTLPEQGGQMDQEVSGASISDEGGGSSGWSEHIWTTWVKRFPSGDETLDSPTVIKLTEVQRQKFANFFTYLLDMDRDDVISLTDFEGFSERLRHFSDWSKNSAEYNRLREVQRGFVETFLIPASMETPIHSYQILEKRLQKEQVSLDEWLHKWSLMLETANNFQQLPLWLQYFPRILFQVINRSGTGIISKDELSAFYSSILGLTTTQVAKFIDEAYKVLTSNGDHLLNYSVYRLCFANFILARNPNGPGQFLLGPVSVTHSACFPIDYKALSCAPQDLEQYSPELTSNRRSVIV